MPWSDCHTHALRTNGSGATSLRERRCRVSKVTLIALWENFYGHVWPAGMQTLHRCDEPRCSNPEHIFPGTASDNMRDSAQKGRKGGSIHGQGERHRFAKLTDADIIAIRALAATGWTNRRIAKRYGVSQPAISRIITGKRWGHVGGGHVAVVD